MKIALKALPSGAAALEKALILFNRIVNDRGNTKLADLAANLALPRSTLYRLTAVLEGAGLIARLERGRYVAGLPLVDSLRGISVASQLARLCRPSLRRLAQTCGATAHLGVMENDMVTYLVKETASTAHAAAFFTRENSQLEAYCSAVGKVLLAWLPDAARVRYLDGAPFVPMTQRTLTDPRALQACLKAVRAEQFARDDGEISDDLYCLAVPLWTNVEPMIAAISLSFPRRDGQQDDDGAYLAKLRTCAAELSLKLGNRNGLTILFSL